jgi:DNA polymerase-3 subunit delta
VVLYGKETDFKQVIDQALQFPMMAAYRVVILKEAQEMSSFEKLESYFNNPSAQTILVVAYKHKKLDKRKKKLWDALKKNAVVFESSKLYDNQIPAYIQSMAADHGMKVSPQIAQLITEHLGSDLSKISNEISKLRLNLPEGTAVDLQHVERYIGISKDFNIFELQKAIGQKDKMKAYKIIQYFARNPKAHPIQMNVGALYNYFSKLFISKKFQNADDRSFAAKVKVNPFFAREYKLASKNFSLAQIRNALHELHELDKKSKGVGTRNQDQLGMYQEFLFKVFA